MKRRASPVYAPLLFLLCAAARAAAPKVDCYSKYDPAYERDWAIRKEDWDAACALGYEPGSALHTLQRKSVSQCARRFLKAAEERKLGETIVHSLCAQGETGRAKLAEMTASPKEAADAPKEDASTATLVTSRLPEGLGPVHQAVEAARSRWETDACLASLLMTVDHLDRAGEEKTSLRYRFYSKARWDETFEFRRPDPASPGIGAKRRKSTGNHCLTAVEIDAGEAVEKAVAAGLKLDGCAKVDIRLDSLSAQMQEALGEKKLGMPPYKALRDKTFWIVSAHGANGARREYVIDARDGDLLHQGAPVRLDALLPQGPPPKE